MLINKIQPQIATNPMSCPKTHSNALPSDFYFKSLGNKATVKSNIWQSWQRLINTAFHRVDESAEYTGEAILQKYSDKLEHFDGIPDLTLL